MKYLRLWVAAAAFFIVGSVSAQQAGTVTSHAFAVGKGAGKSSFTSILCTSAQIALGQSAADPICQTLTGDVTINASGVTAIGASKVTNAQLATMVANTTKCNATGGTTNPTDCTASTMRTNLGLTIGTNVEAWDTDLDCLAAISATGVIHRTGAGTCNAGALALSDIATGTQDTVIGYFGSTAASALAIGNCSNSLTYSTSTHTFGCNTSAGTGTVTSVTCFGVAITSTGTCATAATKSDQQTGTSTTAVVTPSQQQQHDGSAKAWITFTGSTGATLAAYNASATRTSAGNYIISITPTAFASINYVCTVVPTSTSPFTGQMNGTKTINNVPIATLNSGTPADPATVDVVCFGRQ